jgi:hypothetical protein
MAVRMIEQSVTHVLFKAQRALGKSQGELGLLLGASHRTGQRWGSGASIPSAERVETLARHVFPVDASLAAELATEAGTTLENLGLVARPAPPPPPFTPPADRVVDSVVCAASEAMDVMPRAIRPALLAAFTRARELGLSVEAVERSLRGNVAPAQAADAPKRKGG